MQILRPWRTWYISTAASIVTPGNVPTAVRYTINSVFTQLRGLPTVAWRVSAQQAEYLVASKLTLEAFPGGPLLWKFAYLLKTILSFRLVIL